MNRSNLGAVRLPLLAAAVLASFAVSLSAQVVEKGRTFADLTASHPCDTGLTDRIARVTDCDAADDIGDGGGAFQCWAICDGTAPWAAVSIGGTSGGSSGAATSVQGSATLPATCTEKDLYQDTDSGGTEFYVCTATNTWTKTGTGTGDVVGPASATDNAIAIYDSTTGKLVQDSAVTIADTTGNLQWEGTTADAFEGNFTFADPTADWTLGFGATGLATFPSWVIAEQFVVIGLGGTSELEDLRITSSKTISFSNGVDYSRSITGAGVTGPVVKVTSALNLSPLASPPRTCDATAEGDIYADTSHALCFCDGTSWNVLTGSGAGSCA